MTDYTYDEKRDFARMSVETQVSYTLKGDADTTYNGASHDLSATGLSMTTAYKLSVGDEINIVMNGSGDRLPPFVADGQVLRVDAQGDNSFDVSVSFQIK